MKKIETVELFENDPLAKTRMWLMRRLPFFGVLIHKLQPLEKDAEWFEKVGAKGSPMATDGRFIYYDRVSFKAMTEKEQCFVVAHEILHNAYGHFSRLAKRDRLIANCAQDYVINLALVDDAKENRDIQWACPPMALIDEQYRGLNWEQVYDLLMQDGGKKMRAKLGKGEAKSIGWCMDGSGKDNPDGDKAEGEGEGNGPATDADGLATQWKISAEQAAAVARNAGSGSAGMDRLLVDIKQPKHDWRQQIKEYFVIPGDYTWAKPSRKFIGDNVYMPSVKKSKLGHMIFVLDASGSISQEKLSECASEIQGCLDAAGDWPERVTVMSFDSVVTNVEDMEGKLELHPKGGGGTCFQPVFDYVEQAQWTPQVMFFFTDLASSDKPNKPQGYPVVWMVDEQDAGLYENFGWGELVKLPRG